MFGILSYTVLKLVTGKTKQITPMTWVVTALFLIKILLTVISA
jgi:AGZA family xanthine/uracil permease-like MFS transporter